MNSKRYYPNLLPPEHQTLNDYFRGEKPSFQGAEKARPNLGWAGLLLIIAGFFTIGHTAFSLVLFTTGLLLFPAIGRMVARIFRIRLTRSVRRIITIVLLLLNIPLAISFGNFKIRQAEADRAQKIRQQREIQLAAQNEQRRKDSLDFCLKQIADLHKNGRTDQALLALDKADLLTKTPAEAADVGWKRAMVSSDKAKELMAKGQYNMALELLNSFTTNDAGIHYQRAVCYEKTGKTAEAVRHAKIAMTAGNAEAAKLYEKMNPLKKRIAYYTTLCNDGSFSGAKGRGACSHHGGVADWNYPVYETYRKYE